MVVEIQWCLKTLALSFWKVLLTMSWTPASQMSKRGSMGWSERLSSLYLEDRLMPGLRNIGVYWVLERDWLLSKKTSADLEMTVKAANQSMMFEEIVNR